MVLGSGALGVWCGGGCACGSALWNVKRHWGFESPEPCDLALCVMGDVGGFWCGEVGGVVGVERLENGFGDMYEVGVGVWEMFLGVFICCW